MRDYRPVEYSVMRRLGEIPHVDFDEAGADYDTLVLLSGLRLPAAADSVHAALVGSRKILAKAED